MCSFLRAPVVNMMYWSLSRLLWKDAFCCRQRHIAQMTCNVNKVVICFLLSFSPPSWVVVEISRYRTSSGTKCPHVQRDVVTGLEKLHKAITPTVSGVQTCLIWSINLHLFFSVKSNFKNDIFCLLFWIFLQWENKFETFNSVLFSKCV